MTEKVTASASNNAELLWHKYVPALIDRAFKARERAVSHRKIPFKVGVAALVRDPKDGYLSILDGANYKPLPGSDGPRKCGEEEVEEEAERLKLQVIGMVVVAPHQPDDATGIDLGVTPSCVFCRRRWHERHKEHKGYGVQPEAYLLFVNADIPTVRVAMTVERALAIFNSVVVYGR